MHPSFSHSDWEHLADIIRAGRQGVLDNRANNGIASRAVYLGNISYYFTEEERIMLRAYGKSKGNIWGDIKFLVKE